MLLMVAGRRYNPVENSYVKLAQKPGQCNSWFIIIFVLLFILGYIIIVIYIHTYIYIILGTHVELLYL